MDTSLDAQSVAKYTALFNQYCQEAGGVSSLDKASAGLSRSGLPVEKLMHIWSLSDVDRDDRLSLSEYLICCVLIKTCVVTQQPPPTTLPPELAQSAAAAVGPTSGGLDSRSSGSFGGGVDAPPQIPFPAAEAPQPTAVPSNPAALAAPPSNPALSSLVEMGFTAHDAERALYQNGGDVQRAASFLLGSEGSVGVAGGAAAPAAIFPQPTAPTVPLVAVAGTAGFDTSGFEASFPVTSAPATFSAPPPATAPPADSFAAGFGGGGFGQEASSTVAATPVDSFAAGFGGGGFGGSDAISTATAAAAVTTAAQPLDATMFAASTLDAASSSLTSSCPPATLSNPSDAFGGTTVTANESAPPAVLPAAPAAVNDFLAQAIPGAAGGSYAEAARQAAELRRGPALGESDGTVSGVANATLGASVNSEMVASVP